MNQMWLEALGKELKKVIDTYQYPSLTSEIFTEDICDEWRSTLSGLPSSDEALKQVMTKQLHKSTIEEIEDAGQHLLFKVKLKHKGELYQVQLKLENLTWSIVSLQYIGNDTKKRLVWGINVALVFMLLIGSWFMFQKWTEGAPAQTSLSTDDRSAAQNWDEKLFLNHIDDIQKAAKQHGYIIMTEEEFNAALDDHAQQRLIAHLTENESEASEMEKTESEPQAGETKSPEEMVELAIQPGMTSPDIAAQLVEKGLARNEREVLQLFRKLGVDKNIRSGKYHIPSNATYMEIINILTSR
ncbi:hypothetical protein GCM10010965_12320 [Caldalkalibacillus thermarum]|uniref:hypothetical protein n=1 Tax=Caldalkalibacillus thermarum TaxID=296745 RepID=UPI00166E02B1|nr:hypothetical protein [Caldalkalibacillus thermarum]GGK20786.1 hypothetical protein GCM10010965_12320 [Caldalkalibacillus thermarum]